MKQLTARDMAQIAIVAMIYIVLTITHLSTLWPTMAINSVFRK